MEWIEPTIDRMLSDVEFAKNNPGSPENLKGALNISDFNRISNNLLWIKENIPLSFRGYPLQTIPPEWQRTDFFKLADINNYEINLFYLKDLYFLQAFFDGVDFGNKETFGQNGRKTLDYIKINQWERILYYLYTFAYKSTWTWQDFYDTGETWQEDYDKNERWGDLL